MKRIIIHGHIENDADIHESKEKKIAIFTLESHGLSEKKGKVNVWYQINCWGKEWEPLFKYLKKGTNVTVSEESKIPKIYKTKSGEDAIDMSYTDCAFMFRDLRIS